MRVLVVEDSPLECELLVRALAARGHQVLTAADVVGAWDLLRSERIALALIDLHLGLSDGRELLEQIQGLEPADQPHCVVITASSDPQHVRDALAGGAHDFIRKELLHSDLDVRLAVAEQQAENRAKQLRTEALQKALYRISEATHSAQSLDRLCERIYRVLSEVMETPNFYIALMDRGSRVVSFPFWRDERESAPVPRVGGRGLTEHVLQTGQPLLVDRAGQQRLAAEGTVAIASEPPDYWLGVPLCSQGECIGVVGIFSYDRRFRIGEPERQVLDFVSEHVAAGIEHIRTQERLRHQERMAAMGELVAGVAHEIRNPLFGLSALLDALEPTPEGRVETDTEYLGHMHEQIARLGTLVQDLLDYGRPQRPDLVPLALGDLLEECLALSQVRATEADVELRLELDAPDVRVEVDRKRLTQVFHNLIENALGFAPRGSSVRVSATSQGGLVVTRVRDHGPGFASEDVEHVFEPFFTRRMGGTGLGLSIAQRAVEANRGAIRAYNAEDGGAVVEVSLPAAGTRASPPPRS